MNAKLSIVVLPLFAIATFAQNPATPQSTPPAQDSKATTAAPASPSKNGPAPEMKTRSYSGILADASCVAAGPATTPAADSGKPAPDTTVASGAAPTAKTKAADPNQAARADQGQSCSISASTTQFAIKLKEGQIVKLDGVGNQRAQELLKNNKKWSEAAASGKSIHVAASGVLNGDQLIAMSIK
jgi:hypothetical protein